MAGKGGGAWKVAYADFVTAMMAFFLVMWITGQSKPIKESVAKYFNDPFGGPSTKPNGSSFQRSMENGDSPYSRGKPKIGPSRGPVPIAKPKPNSSPPEDSRQARRPTVFTLHGGDRSHVGTVLIFGEHSAELDDHSRESLNDVIPLMVGKPNKIEVRGHATRRPLPEGSPYRSPWDLCFARCEITQQYLIKRGISPERIRLSQAGPYEPQQVDVPQGEENSRVEVYLLPEFVHDLQGSGSQLDTPPRDPAPPSNPH